MIVPSIDIQQGRAVQLRRGAELLMTDPRDPEDLAVEFNRYGPVAVVDLDAALGEYRRLYGAEPLYREVVSEQGVEEAMIAVGGSFIQLLEPLSAAGVDVFHASTRRFWEPAFEGSGRTLAAWTRHITGKPVIAVGGLGLDDKPGPGLPADLAQAARGRVWVTHLQPGDETSLAEGAMVVDQVPEQ